MSWGKVSIFYQQIVTKGKTDHRRRYASERRGFREEYQASKEVMLRTPRCIFVSGRLIMTIWPSASFVRYFGIKVPVPPCAFKSYFHSPPMVTAFRLLSPERAALGESGLATGGLAENGRAAGADDDGLGVGEDGGDGEAAGALDVHEEGSGGRHKGLEKESQSD